MGGAGLRTSDFHRVRIAPQAKPLVFQGFLCSRIESNYPDRKDFLKGKLKAEGHQEMSPKEFVLVSV
jgi:hypothetical protein